MSNANAPATLQTFEILLGTDRATVRVAGIAAVADYLRPGRPDVKLAKRGYTTWQVRSGGRIVGSVQEVSR
jgi:hypothetical protein